MKRIATFVLSVAATFLTTGAAVAQQNVDRVTIPFDFTVNGTSLPAGDYTIASNLNNPAALIIRDEAGNALAMSVGMNDRTGELDPGTLIFHQYGDQYFLRNVSFAGFGQAVFFPASALEQRAIDRNVEAGVAEVSSR